MEASESINETDNCLVSRNSPPPPSSSPAYEMNNDATSSIINSTLESASVQQEMEQTLDGTIESAENDDEKMGTSQSLQQDGTQLEATQKAETSEPSGRKKRRRKRGRRTKFEPYTKISHEQKCQLQQVEKDIAESRRQEMFKKGRPIAPYNTTQYIINSHSPVPIDYKSNINHLRQETNSESPAYVRCMLDVEEMDSNIQKDFENDYQASLENHFSSMTRGSLTREHLRLQNEKEKLDKQLEDQRKKFAYLTEGLCLKEGDEIDEMLKKVRKDHEVLLRKKARREGKNEDSIILPWCTK